MANPEHIRWDSWEVVQDAISARAQGTVNLVVVLWGQTWNPTGLHAAQCFEAIRQSGKLDDTQIFIVDKDKNLQKALEFEVVTCPSLLMYWKGENITIRRCFRNDTNKYVGSVKQETWVEILKEGREAGLKYDQGETFLRAFFEH
uniref:Thioredoxin domain-containing protein n=1 Tax=Pyramimonas obovata TaxID=1411642 RepID=A0A7S0MVG5_9CHLO|eukprot:CAMPEP_0118929376 /NCGR_PEP_ID=MMETSP1169-20130426/6395_1 /TAXON_ID=36882 /ORGANISM="Pyramimonas obovata, Strain CCMP722" /LENGTH=144 /DNA_ID=CAMNT_0006871557 /DNA_START=331 /DNA_END=765 /DNA_ORIENTATION=-